jgi:hypothetical protein
MLFHLLSVNAGYLVEKKEGIGMPVLSLTWRGALR